MYQAVNNPSEPDTPSDTRETGQLCQFGGNGGNSGGNGGDPDDSGVYQTIATVRNNTYKRSEFILVKSINITIPTFSGTNLSTSPHMLFYKAMRRLIYSQGEDGEMLLEVLDEIEKHSKEAFTNAQFKELVRQRPKAAEYNRAILTALLNNREARLVVSIGLAGPRRIAIN